MNDKIIPLKVNASFFFERALRCLDKMNYKGAMRYFRRAIEHDPQNALNHCNLAGVLSEVGDYKESNKILFRVINYIDRKAFECYYYIANNYANMGDYERAATYASKYLAVEADGEFSYDAEELLEFFGDENDIYDFDTCNNDVAKRLLEEGKYKEASKELLFLLKQNPDYHVARNNLAITYFYLGNTELAIEETLKVLEMDADNIHAHCNAAIFYLDQQYEDKARVERMYLRALTPLYDDHVYKLAITLGILGEHEQAYRHFRRLVRREVTDDYQVYFMLGVAAANTGRYTIALQNWKKAHTLDQASEIPRFYIQIVEEAIRTNKPLAMIGYFYHLPFEEHLKRVELRLEKKLTTEALQEPMIKASLYWALENSSEQTKLNAIRLLSLVFNNEVKEEFAAFLIKPEENDELKRVILILFHQYNIAGPYEVILKKKRVQVTEEQVSKMYITWKPEWIQVLEVVIGKIEEKNGDSTSCIADLEAVWIEFLSKRAVHMPKRFHVMSWAAALEYAVFSLHDHKVTQRQIADKYQVSVATVSLKYQELVKTCEHLQNSKWTNG